MANKTSQFNLGLPSNFQLSSGKIVLTGGTDKADNTLRFLLQFNTWFRLYNAGFVVPFNALVQKSSSYVEQYKGYFRLRILNAVKENAPFVKVSSVDIVKEVADRKSLGVIVNYAYNIPDTAEKRTVKFVKTA